MRSSLAAGVRSSLAAGVRSSLAAGVRSSLAAGPLLELRRSGDGALATAAHMVRHRRGGRWSL